MYIAPNSTIKLLKNVPLDSTYNHTLFWYTQAEQQAYFSSCAKYTLEQQSYQRYAKGTMRIALNADLLYDCNYLMFQNTAYGNKWFYAFIKEIEYVSNGACQVTYVIDVMQTWFFDFNLQQCFVEREHTQDDSIGANTVPEGLEQGPYYVAGSGELPSSDDPLWTSKVFLVTSFDPNNLESNTISGKYVNGVYNGTYITEFRYAFLEELNTLLTNIVNANKSDGVLAIYMIPFGVNVNKESVATEAVATSKLYGSFNGYTPKNNKLYAYPYNILHVYNDSATADFRYELFSGSNCTFQLNLALAPEPTMTLCPTAYAGKSGQDLESRLTTSSFPVCAWSSDTYKAYIAANSHSLPVRMIGAAINAASSVINAGVGVGTMIATQGASGMGNIAGGIGGLINTGLQVAALNAQLEDIKTKPPQMNGSQTGAIDYAIGAKYFHYKKLKIRGEYAKVIDDYFTMYGYATRRVKVPNLDVRERWCYTKTVGCVVKGNVPSDDLNYICRIFDNGITFWKNPSEVGNYSLSNLPEVG